MEKILVPGESSRRADSETPKLFENRSSFDRFTAVRSFENEQNAHFSCFFNLGGFCRSI